MNIVKNLRIGSVDYEVILTDENIVLNGRECKGMIDYEFHQVKINNKIQDLQGQEQTFLHELVHGIVRERNLDLVNSDEETIVDEIAIGLHQVIRDNPDIFKSNEKTIELMCNGKRISEIEKLQIESLRNKAFYFA